MLDFKAILTDSNQFEALCYDLVRNKGFQNVCWRGPGADGGRDIEADWFLTDPTGNVIRQRWYIECKFYSDSVPFPEVQPKLFAAWRDSCDALLVITNADLRNTCLDAVDRWISDNGRRLRFRYWNGHDLTKEVVSDALLMEKYFAGTKLPDNTSQVKELILESKITRMLRDRISTVSISRLQSVERRLINLPKTGTPSFSEEAKHLSYLTTILGSFRLLNETNPSPVDRFVNLETCLQKVLSWFQPGLSAKSKLTTISGLKVNVSPVCLRTILFELIENAFLYGCNQTEITLEKSPSVWIITVTNDMNISMSLDLDSYPQPGVRHEKAISIKPSGQGLGSWISKELAKFTGISVKWEIDLNLHKWIAKVSGSVH